MTEPATVWPLLRLAGVTVAVRAMGSLYCTLVGAVRAVEVPAAVTEKLIERVSDPLWAWMVTLPARLAVSVPVLASPPDTLTGAAGRLLTLPGPALWVNVTAPLLLDVPVPCAAAVTSTGLAAATPLYSAIRTSGYGAEALKATVTVLLPAGAAAILAA